MRVVLPMECLRKNMSRVSKVLTISVVVPLTILAGIFAEIAAVFGRAAININ